MIHTITTGYQSLKDFYETLCKTELEMNNSQERYERAVASGNQNLIDYNKSIYETKSKIFIDQHKAYLELLVEIEKKDL